MSTLALSVASLLAFGMWIFSMLAAFFLGQNAGASAVVRLQHQQRESLLTSIGDLWDRLTGNTEKKEEEEDGD